jgi:hypothetical protein
MDTMKFIEAYGIPKNWELATEIEAQIESYRSAVAFLAKSDAGRLAHIKSAPRIFEGETDESALKNATEYCTERVAQPVVDLDKINYAKLPGIRDNGGWGRYTPGLK